MPSTRNGLVTNFHAHVYFDENCRGHARDLREDIERLFQVEMGRWHEKKVGPHPRWSYQIAFEHAVFNSIVPWLMINRRGLTVFLHPNTGNNLSDHRDSAAWMGEMLELNLEIFSD